MSLEFKAIRLFHSSRIHYYSGPNTSHSTPSTHSHPHPHPTPSILSTTTPPPPPTPPPLSPSTLPRVDSQPLGLSSSSTDTRCCCGDSLWVKLIDVMEIHVPNVKCKERPLYHLVKNKAWHSTSLSSTFFLENFRDHVLCQQNCYREGPTSAQTSSTQSKTSRRTYAAAVDSTHRKKKNVARARWRWKLRLHRRGGELNCGFPSLSFA